MRTWFRISVFNFLLVAVLGVLMRYKIVFSLPFLNQRHILNAHSHFAFAGWLTQVLMSFIALYISQYHISFSLSKYNKLLLANIITAYGMLFSFPFEGYGIVSIIFSTLSIFVSYFFAIIVWNDLNRTVSKTISHYWLKAALVFNVLSSLGPFTLAYMMATKHIYQNIYLSSIYFFLHFQYNGWFFFGCMGLLVNYLGNFLSLQQQKIIFYLFVFSCPLTYFLSLLWLNLPLWLYILVVVASFAQTIAWFFFFLKLMKEKNVFFSKSSSLVKVLFCLSAIALSIKLLLQLGSSIPSLSSWAFGFRPIVIGYLHLIFLGIFSLFMLAFGLEKQLLETSKQNILGIRLLVAGIFLNEILLMAEGLGAIHYNPIPFVDECLFVAALTIFLGLFFINMPFLTFEQKSYRKKIKAV